MSADHHSERAHSRSLRSTIEPPPGQSWEPPASLTAWKSGPADLGASVADDAPRPNPSLSWVAETTAGSHANYDHHFVGGGATVEFPLDDPTQFSHHYPPADPDNPEEGWGRMKVLFEYVIHEAAKKLAAIDGAIAADSSGSYATAVTAFKQFCGDWNRPPSGSLGTAAGKKYPVQWLYVMPTIRSHRIVGSTIILSYNPHSSSSLIHG